MAKFEHSPETPSADGRPIAEETSNPADRRRFPRVKLDAAVTVRAPSARVLFQSRIRDLSQSGVFLLTTSSRPIGTEIALEIDVEGTGLRLKCRGIVVHVVSGKNERDSRPPGLGVMFTEVDDAAQASLRAMVAFAQRQSG